jgi:hypothetical protein
MPEEKSKNSGMGGTCLLPFNASKQTESKQKANRTQTERNRKRRKEEKSFPQRIAKRAEIC